MKILCAINLKRRGRRQAHLTVEGGTCLAHHCWETSYLRVDLNESILILCTFMIGVKRKIQYKCSNLISFLGLGLPYLPDRISKFNIMGHPRPPVSFFYFQFSLFSQNQ